MIVIPANIGLLEKDTEGNPQGNVFAFEKIWEPKQYITIETKLGYVLKTVRCGKN